MHWFPVLLLFGFIQLAFLLLLLVGLYRVKRPVGSSSAELPPISVIIAARDEYQNLLQHLPFVLDQNYPEFEVIAVINGSSDLSVDAVRSLQLKFPQLRYLSLLEGNKKKALTAGILAAKYHHFAFIDADCAPADLNWLHAFGASFSVGNDIVLGTGFFKAESTLMNALYRVESAKIAMLYMAAVGLKQPYMAVGRSMAYTRKTFDAAGGFKNHIDLLSGDDDLFLQSAALNFKVGVAAEALTFSKAPISWNKWLHQKARHLEAGKRYPWLILAFLMVFDLSALGWTLAMISLIVYFPQIEFSLLIMALSISGLCATLFFFLSRKLDLLVGSKGYAVKLFVLHPLLAIVNPILSMSSQLVGKRAWKIRA